VTEQCYKYRENIKEELTSVTWNVAVTMGPLPTNGWIHQCYHHNNHQEKQNLSEFLTINNTLNEQNYHCKHMHYYLQLVGKRTKSKGEENAQIEAKLIKLLFPFIFLKTLQ
jgi:hypothetical protein